MYSMTGYGKGEYREGGVEIVVEAKSVNNRFLDIAVKSPRIFAAHEELLRKIVRENISRGHIDLFVSYADRRERERTYSVDLSAAQGYVRAAEKLAAQFPSLENDVKLSFLLRSPEVFGFEEVAAGADEVLVSALEKAARDALSALSAMRLAEGERIKEDLCARVKTVADLRDKIALRAPLVAEEYRKKLTERVAEYLGGKLDETRILTEAAVYADKCNIDEELTRLASHIEEFGEICKTDRVGRKLDFLVQEFNRECNTICSKSNDAAVTALALEMKNEIEKIREQIQNME